MRKLFLQLTMLAFFLLGCTEPVSRDLNPRILAMGDSLLATHEMSGKSVSHAIEEFLGEPVIDRSVAGARFFYALPISGAMGMNISKQYRPGNWDWVVLNGGGNDLWLGCGCILCNRKLNRLIADDGESGKIPALISDLRKTGARVIFVGYLRSPGVNSLIEHCKDEGDELERRINNFANQDEGVYFLSLKDLVPNGDRSFHTVDMIHPSVRGSAAIGARVAQIIQQ
ncbi:SGNH/GDSL hydrolase family protein [Pseudohalocynthiibacter aestuariivivens]|jgi:lysophospholipase L1-like esterase|uniref:SGNH/GDSL hydrolase family protein n=1 Tax=Pseudohalocynthiibacter aestuariivivens TaxID=1591409 RepID=A0ABV5JF84_9RHOB|nr:MULTISPECIES: SGNH/GDSL hydrolase family protein [Pseudohalocynthiibacter]MBS9717067.1 SGNH/GDSL hydrolase family protein [Pseudohalocynthiibacter aestuariivivens]MCK0104009.1 SGNH/GDSL hydrolase family protein [Pseudohalocynthiibacter sp. F2068]